MSEAESGATLGSILADHVTLLEGAVGARGSEGMLWTVDGVLFAVSGSASAEFRLRPEVAAAARRTPDVGPSPRGAGWVRFAPPVLDGFAMDRARAWLESAWRVAEAGSED